MRSLLVKIILPSRTILDVSASMVNLPGQEGVFGVLPGHCRLISNLDTGLVSVFLHEQEQKYFVYKGVAQVTGAELNILSEFACLFDQKTKKEALDNITVLQNNLLDHEKGTLESQIILDKLEKYQDLLKF